MATTTTASTTFVLQHGECEHSGDLERDTKALRAAGLRFSVVWDRVANGPEVGITVIRTEANLAGVRAAIAKGDSCIDFAVPGGIEKAESLLAEAEYEFEDEESEDDY